MNSIIVTTPEALEALIEGTFEKKISQLTALSTPTTSPPEIIDTKELIRRLNVTEPTIIRMRKKQILPFMQIGSAVRYNWHAVVKALENKKKGK